LRAATRQINPQRVAPRDNKLHRSNRTERSIAAASSRMQNVLPSRIDAVRHKAGLQSILQARLTMRHIWSAQCRAASRSRAAHHEASQHVKVLVRLPQASRHASERPGCCPLAPEAALRTCNRALGCAAQLVKGDGIRRPPGTNVRRLDRPSTERTTSSARQR
jgi:hypothetical protein